MCRRFSRRRVEAGVMTLGYLPPSQHPVGAVDHRSTEVGVEVVDRFHTNGNGDEGVMHHLLGFGAAAEEHGRKPDEDLGR